MSTFTHCSLALVALATLAHAGDSRRLVSEAAGQQPISGASLAAVSADGRFAAFTADGAGLVPEDTTETSDVFVKNLATGVVEMVSVSSLGVPGSGGSVAPRLSHDGRYVAFLSQADNFDPSTPDFATQVFRHDRKTGITKRIGAAADGSAPNSHVIEFDLTADGKGIAFLSLASNLTAGDDPNSIDAFFVDCETNATELISTGPNGKSDGAVLGLHMSSNGRYVAFDSNAENLVAGPSNNAFAVYLRDRKKATTSLVSRLPDGSKPPLNAFVRAASPELGVLYIVSASQLHPDGQPATGTYRHDRVDGVTEPFTIEGVAAAALVNCFVKGASSKGRRLVLSCLDSNALANDLNQKTDVAIYDVAAKKLRAVTTSVTNKGFTCSLGGNAPVISNDGRHVLFESATSDFLAQPDANGAIVDVFMRTFAKP